MNKCHRIVTLAFCLVATPLAAQNVAAPAARDFRNGPIATTCGTLDGQPRAITLRDGRWSAPESDADGWVFAVTDVLLADVTGDGREDAVVTTTCDDSGTAPPRVSVMLFPGAIGTTPIDALDAGVWDGSSVVSIRGDLVTLTTLPIDNYGPVEGRRARSVYRWNRSRLVRVGGRTRS